MAAGGEIKSSFARLRVEHLLVYLPNKGWQSAREVREDRVRFELPDEGDAYVLLLPKSNQAPQARTILQRVIYTLSGIEDRQPGEILEDLLAVDPNPAAATSPPGSTSPASALRLRLRNDGGEALVLKVASRPAENCLMPGEAIEVLCRPESDGSLGIRFAGAAIEIDDLAPEP